MADFNYGRVRQTAVDQYSAGSMAPVATNAHSETLVVQALPPKSELVRLGNSWSVIICAASKFTHVAAAPTTLYELALYNGEAGNGKSYIIDSVWSFAQTSMAAAGSIVLLGQIVSGIAALSNDTAQLITSRSGKTYNGAAKRAVHGTTMVADRWEVLQTSISGGSATAQIGLGVYADVFGGWILRPGDTFGVNLVAGTAAGTSIMGITWHEVQLDLG